MREVMRRPFPTLFGMLSFPELNLRTYVESEGKAGVWFLSLDADNIAVVATGRKLYGLPYFRARMVHRRVGDWVEFDSVRSRGPARFAARYRSTGAPAPAASGTFEHWIAERYCMYAGDSERGLWRVDVHHEPWPLQAAEIEIHRNEILAASGIELLPGQTPVCHYSSGVHVVSYPMMRVGEVAA
jgi:uncharacterized protein YqjF (DUF2071 family)